MILFLLPGIALLTLYAYVDRLYTEMGKFFEYRNGHSHPRSRGGRTPVQEPLRLTGPSLG